MIKIVLFFSLITSFSWAKSGSLGEALSQHKKTFTERMPKDVVDLYESNIKDLKASGLEKQTLKIGDNVPNVTVMLGNEKHPLSQIYAAGPLVLKFYRGGWCPYCMVELKHYEKMFPQFKKAGAQILGLSPDSQEMTNKTQSTNNFSFDILSDDGLAIARQFGLVYKVDSKVIENLQKNGIDLSMYQGNKNHELAIPATFVINTDGKIAFVFVDADYRKRAEPAQVLHVVRNLKK